MFWPGDLKFPSRAHRPGRSPGSPSQRMQAAIRMDMRETEARGPCGRPQGWDNCLGQGTQSALLESQLQTHLRGCRPLGQEPLLYWDSHSFLPTHPPIRLPLPLTPGAGSWPCSQEGGKSWVEHLGGRPCVQCSGPGAAAKEGEQHHTVCAGDGEGSWAGQGDEVEPEAKPGDCVCVCV